MKTIKPYLILVCLSLSAWLNAQHYVTGSLQGGYSGTFDKIDQTKSRGLLGAQIGVGYEWQYEHLLMDIGAEFSYYSHRWSITDQGIIQRMMDTDGMLFDYIGDVTGRSDVFTSTSLRFPVLAGAQFGKFYFLAGLVPDIHFNGTASATADLKTYGDYVEFYNPLTDMENHGFYSRGISNQQDMRYKFDLLGHVELGVTFGDKHKYRLAAFAEVGMLDIAPRTDVGYMAQPDFSKYMQVTLNNPYVSKEGMFAAAHNMEFGIKFSVAIHVGDNKEKEPKEDNDSIQQAIQDSIAQALQDSINQAVEDSLAQASAREAAKRIAEEERRAANEAAEARKRAVADSIARANNKYFGPHTQLGPDDLGSGEKYILEDIYFDTDKTIVMVPSLPTLKQLYKLMLQNPDLKIKIVGHTDSQGSDWYNLHLSRRRANSVKETLYRWGIDESRMTTEGRGEREPIAPNETPTGRQLNRRVVFEIQ